MIVWQKENPAEQADVRPRLRTLVSFKDSCSADPVMSELAVYLVIAVSIIVTGLGAVAVIQLLKSKKADKWQPFRKERRI